MGRLAVPLRHDSWRTRHNGRLLRLAAVIPALLAFVACGGSNPEDNSADEVFDAMVAAGLPITDGTPANSEFRSVVDSNRCADSRAFVRTDTVDTGWGFICVGIDQATFERVSEAFDKPPLIVGPLYADAFDGKIVVLGFGWPIDASQIAHDALGDPEGRYLVR